MYRVSFRATEWKAIIDLCQSKGYDVGFLFIVQSSNYLEFEQKMEMNKFTYPIIYDLADDFNNLNKFPNDNRCRTFLLNRDNEIVLIGSPIHSGKMRELYFNILSKTEKQVLTQEAYLKLLKNRTSVNVVQNYINFGEFSYMDYKQASFKLSNTGSYPLIIQEVNTFCGCTVAKYDKKPIAQGEATNIILEYKPNSLGYFRKTANVVCNIPEGSVRLTISGEVTK